MRIAEIALIISMIVLFLIHEFILEKTLLFSVLLTAVSIFYFIHGIPLIMKLSLKKAFNIEQKSNFKYFILSAVTGIIISFSLMSILFKLMQWPGWQLMMLVTGTMGSIVILLSSIFFIKRKNKIFLNVGIRLFVVIVLEAYFILYW
jgi:hypothetical protein